MKKYNYGQLYSDVLLNCRNWTFDLNWQKAKNNSLEGLFHSMRLVDGGDDLLLIDTYPSNLQHCDFNNFSYINNLPYLFKGCRQLQTLNNIDNWDTNNIINLSYTFSSCDNLDFSCFYNLFFNNVEDLSGTFSSLYYCSDFNWISNWNLSKVKNLSDTFYYCPGFQNIEVSNWNINNVIDYWILIIEIWVMQKIYLICLLMIIIWKI